MIDFDTIVLLALIVAGVWMFLLSYRISKLEERLEDEDEQDT